MKFSRKSPSAHLISAQFTLKSAKNDFSGNFRNFRENRIVSTQSAKNDFSGNFRENHPVSIQLVLNSP
ncbi:hypothetical protein T11_765 [Trichinella zimbabwensis]|uniref:Uncharacterized protein n=1 Tax=Trichinella zimbabwensis TaxID=268475 RepID=A0A0V1GGQ7_9BILA|nr:hypothetical protein T11_765 [Trichinella zimbabwensis]